MTPKKHIQLSNSSTGAGSVRKETIRAPLDVRSIAPDHQIVVFIRADAISIDLGPGGRSVVDVDVAIERTNQRTKTSAWIAAYAGNKLISVCEALHCTARDYPGASFVSIGSLNLWCGALAGKVAADGQHAWMY
jgi:hypothetical protein